MPNLKNLAAAEAALQPFIPSVAEITGRDITLERMWPMMKQLGNPEKQLRIIHVAGTSGKTSTAYYLAALFQAAGQLVGLHVSPHIDKVTERFQLNGQPISDELFCSQLGEFLDIIYKYNFKPTYFELHIAFAYWFFVRQGVDYAVIETGMGGLHDGTNVAQNPNKVCVITDIGIDHTKFLGTTLPEIAFQKAGIIHPDNLVFMYEQAPEITEVFTKKCKDVKAKLSLAHEDVEHEHYGKLLEASLPLYQQRNWLLAYLVYRNVAQRDGLVSLDEHQLMTTQELQVPGRMDLRRLGDKTLVMDGAHNQQKMTAFVRTFRAKYPNEKAAILLSLKTGKDFKQVVDALLPIMSRVVTTTFDTSQELPVVSMDPTELAEYCTAKGVPFVSVQADHHQGYQSLITSPERILVITGSFYLLYQIRSEEHLV